MKAKPETKPKPRRKPKPKKRAKRPGRGKSNVPLVPGEKYRPAVMEELDPKHKAKVVKFISVTDTPTDLDCACILCPMASPRSMGRPTGIYLKWHRDTTELNRAVEEGFLAQDGEGPHRDPPHFGIGQDGTVLQFLDPTRNGSGQCSSVPNLSPSFTITIVQLQSRDVGRRPSAAQVKAADTLIKRLVWLYGTRPTGIIDSLEWKARLLPDHPAPKQQPQKQGQPDQ